MSWVFLLLCLGLDGLPSNAAAGIAPLMSNLPFLSSPFMHAGLFPWSAATTSGSLQDAAREKMSDRSTAKLNPFGESDLMNQLSQWQQLMALNMLSMDPMNSLFGRFANGLRPPLTTSAASLDRLRMMQQPVQSADTSKKPLSDYFSDKPLDLSRKRPTPSTPLSTSSAKSARLNAATVDGEDSDVLLADDERPIPSDASTPAVETIAKLASTKRNYSQTDLDKAVMDIPCGRLGTRRAPVVYGIPRSTLRNKIYKLEAAEDNSVGSSKKRLLTAYASRKKEKQLPTDRTSPTSSPSTTFDGEPLWPPTMVPCSGFQLTPSPQNIGSDDPPAAEDDSGDSSLLPGVFNASLAQTMPSSAANSPSVDTSSSIAFAFSRIINSSFAAKKTERKPKEQSTTPPNEGDDAEKRARPKRGQYRRYDKCALDKAVASVRSGEMSVHCAGSFYGVPHSTLEYKVKERNLLRNKQRRPPASTPQTNSGSASGNESTDATAAAPAPEVLVTSSGRATRRRGGAAPSDSSSAASGGGNSGSGGGGRRPGGGGGSGSSGGGGGSGSSGGGGGGNNRDHWRLLGNVSPYLGPIIMVFGAFLMIFIKFAYRFLQHSRVVDDFLSVWRLSALILLCIFMFLFENEIREFIQTYIVPIFRFVNKVDALTGVAVADK